MKKYDKYKDTNIEWIGEIPEHWQFVKTKWIFDISKERITETNPTILSLTKKGIKVRDVSNNEGQVSASYANYAKVRLGDIILNPMDLISGFVDSAKIEGIISPAYTILRPSSLGKYPSYSDYHNYYFQKHYLEGILFHLGEGVSAEHRWTLKNYDLNQLEIIVPPVQEQVQISSYIDNKTSLIDKLINNNNKLIKLLEEKRTALINKVITKGLDPNVKMKDSGIEWIGEIPEHWKVKKGKYLFTILSGYAPSDVLIQENGINYYKVNDLNSTDLNMFLEISEATVEGGKQYNGETIIFPKRGGAIATNKLAIVYNEFLFDTNLMGLQLTNEHDFIKYFAYYIKNRNLYNIADVSTIPQINNKHINPLEFIYPPHTEQVKISSYLDKKGQEIANLITNIKKHNLLLKEYRQSLISNVVTGKVKAAN